MTSVVRNVVCDRFVDSTVAYQGAARGLGVEVDIDHRVVTRKGKPIWLTRHEWGVLREMALNPNTVLGHAELLTTVWGADYRDDVRTLRTTIGKLRRKLGVPRSTGGPIKTGRTRRSSSRDG